MAKPQTTVKKIYEGVIEDVINNVRESFLDDGVDDQVLQELKQIWETKLAQTRAVDAPALGDRPARPQMYTYYAPTSGQQRAAQTVVYQAVPAQTVQLSTASQQARLAAADVMYQPQGGGIVVPGQNQIYAPYPVTVLGQPAVQIQQTRAVGGSGQPIVLTSVPQAGSSQQQSVANQQQPSAIVQADGSNEEPSTSGQSAKTKESGSLTKIHPAKRQAKAQGKRKHRVNIVLQFDGGNDSSSSEDLDDDDNDDEDDDDEEDEDEEEEAKEEEKPDEEPLCTDDDDSDQDANELFDTDNVVVCQYDKIHRAKAKWKFNLKVGIMNLKGKDEVFQKAVGEADW